MVEKILKKISGWTINVGISARKETAGNGGEYIILSVYRSAQSIASTSNGKYYIRVSDDCKPIPPDELARLVAEKGSFIWEEKVYKKIHFKKCDKSKLQGFIQDLNKSDRISKFIKDKSTEDKLEYYMLTQNDLLTNLGILWLGTRTQRAGLNYAPSVQFIKYDEMDNKVNKIVWDDFTKNPKELIEDIINNIPDWHEYTEISDGIFRKNIYNYEPDVIRELISNAFAHRNYSMRGDIFINLFTDRLEIHSPGLLPLGVTPQNILSKSVQRNQLLAKLMYDLRLMEKEGSGYDKIYEIQLLNGKQPPVVEEEDDRVVVTLYKNIISKEALRVVQKASEEFLLKQRELITLGLIAQHGDISTVDLSDILNISKPHGLKYWLGRLSELELVLSKGKTKGTIYYINPKFLKLSDFKSQTTLKKIEKHRLKELIIADLNDYPNSSISDINDRIGKEINRRRIKQQLDELETEDKIAKTGEKKWTRYSIDKKGFK